MYIAYNYLLFTHIITVGLSGLLYFTRLSSTILGADWAYNKYLKIITYIIDAILFSAAISLWIILPSDYFENGWLYTKILFVLLYIISGYVAMRRRVELPIRGIFGIISILSFIMIIGIAVNHNPLGWFA